MKVYEKLKGSEIVAFLVGGRPYWRLGATDAGRWVAVLRFSLLGLGTRLLLTHAGISAVNGSGPAGARVNLVCDSGWSCDD